MVMKKEIKLFLFLISFLLIHIGEVYAQKDTAKAKKYSMRIAGDIDVENSDLPSGPPPGYAIVWGCDGYIIVENKKNTGLEGGLSYGEKKIDNNNENLLMSDYASLFISFRHDAKIIYYGIGLAEELKIMESVSSFLNWSPPADNLGLMIFLGVKKAIGSRSNLFVQAVYLKDIFPDINSNFTNVGYPGNNFVNYGLSIGWSYRINY
jgi:hypothetical protein